MKQFYTIDKKETDVKFRYQSPQSSVCQLLARQTGLTGSFDELPSFDDVLKQYGFQFQKLGEVQYIVNGWTGEYLQQDLMLAGLGTNIKGKLLFTSSEDIKYIAYFGDYDSSFFTIEPIDFDLGLDNQLNNFKTRQKRFDEISKKLTEFDSYSEYDDAKFLEEFKDLKITSYELFEIIKIINLERDAFLNALECFEQDEHWETMEQMKKFPRPLANADLAVFLEDELKDFNIDRSSNSKTI